MPRVSQKIAKQTRERIIRSAIEIIMNRGAADLTFSILAKEANISRSGINSHFKLKSDLMAEIWPQIADGIQRRLDFSSPEDFYISWTKAIDSDMEFCRLILASGDFTTDEDGFNGLIKSIKSNNIEITKMYVYQALGYSVANLRKNINLDKNNRKTIASPLL